VEGVIKADTALQKKSRIGLCIFELQRR